MSKKLYHYTSEHNIESISKEGLLNMFGFIFFTTDDKDEPSVNFAPFMKLARVVVEYDDSYERVDDLLLSDYDLMASYFNPQFIGLISDTSKWYVSRDEVITDMIIEIEKDGKWEEVPCLR